MNLSKDSDNNDIKISKFYQYCKQTEDIILLFDNVENLDNVIKILNFETLGKPIIITSRKSFKQDSIEIKPFNLNESKIYLKKAVPHLLEKENDLILEYLNSEKQCLTYKLVLIAGLIKNDFTITVSELIESDIINTYFSKIIKKIEKKSKDAIELLKYFCFLDPDEISGFFNEEDSDSRADIKTFADIIRL